MEQKLKQEYNYAMELARRIAVEVGEPLFLSDRKREISLSEELFLAEPTVQDMLQIIASKKDFIGHGLLHVRKVAIDAGAIILTEREGDIVGVAVARGVALVHVAGLLHDICRGEEDHARRGAEEATKILSDFPFAAAERDAIATAIRNHEAFRPHRTDISPEAKLLSDALYDADKFRWGPDNFTETVWAMIAPQAIPLRELMSRFPEGMKEIARIRGSFRSVTGKRYGPDFIDRGLMIGLRLHAELTGNPWGTS